MKIRNYLDETGLTLAEFAARVRVSGAAMSRYARGKRTPRPDVVRRIVAASGGRIQANDLFDLAAGAAGAPSPDPGFENVEILIPDLNGTLRGKHIAGGQIEKAMAGHVRLPGSLFGTDITGDNPPGTGLVWAIGDADKVLSPADGQLRPVPWAARPAAQLLMTMRNEDGSPFYGDPRQVLAGAVARFAATGLRPVIALELEFCLLDRERDEDGGVQPPRSPLTGRRERETQVYGIEEIEAFSTLFDDIAEACTVQQVPASTAVSELTPGQYEVNLMHVDDPLAAADHAVLLKRIVKALARKHGFEATFMAKPFSDQVGNGLHLHLSLVDEAGRNLFDGGGGTLAPQLAPLLGHAIAGLQATMAEAMAIFAPNANSYRRFRPGSYAPHAPTWGIENRTVALRVPGGSAEARRVEHRVAGADANVYLVTAAILAGIQHGLAQGLDPGPRTTGNAYEKTAPSLSTRWIEALDRFDRGGVIREALGEEFCRLYAIVKRHELAKFEAIITPRELDWYLQAV
jgi:glutamine synthetase